MSSIVVAAVLHSASPSLTIISAVVLSFIVNILCHPSSVLKGYAVKKEMEQHSQAVEAGTSKPLDDGDDEVDLVDDDDDLDIDELNELEANLSKTTLEIHEPVT